MFCEFDMTHGYWHLLLHVDSYECQSFVTADGIFTRNRVLHGNLNANPHQNSEFMSKILLESKDKLLIWVDSLAIAATDVKDPLKYITKLLDFCAEVNF